MVVVHSLLWSSRQVLYPFWFTVCWIGLYVPSLRVESNSSTLDLELCHSGYSQMDWSYLAGCCEILFWVLRRQICLPSFLHFLLLFLSLRRGEGRNGLGLKAFSETLSHTSILFHCHLPGTLLSFSSSLRLSVPKLIHFRFVFLSLIIKLSWTCKTEFGAIFWTGEYCLIRRK